MANRRVKVGVVISVDRHGRESAGIILNKKEKKTAAFFFDEEKEDFKPGDKVIYKSHRKRYSPAYEVMVIIRKKCTKSRPFPGKRNKNEFWTHADADWTDDDTGRFLKCPNCGIIIDLGPDIV